MPVAIDWDDVALKIRTGAMAASVVETDGAGLVAH